MPMIDNGTIDSCISYRIVTGGAITLKEKYVNASYTIQSHLHHVIPYNDVVHNLRPGLL